MESTTPSDYFCNDQIMEEEMWEAAVISMGVLVLTSVPVHSLVHLVGAFNNTRMRWNRLRNKAPGAGRSARTYYRR